MEKRILVLCTGNSCRSQMAHGFLEHLSGPKTQVYSAGIETHGLNPDAVATMKRAHLDISQNTSNKVSEYQGISFDLVLTVCDHAHEHCPVIQPTPKTKVHINFRDPSKVSYPNSEAKEEAFDAVRDEIQAYCKRLIEDFSL